MLLGYEKRKGHALRERGKEAERGRGERETERTSDGESLLKELMK